ncbi:DUF2339 domain-containing protein [Parageobacillus thermoglucosidasius]|uniref:DUF2339 domain-containing protein n=1 Tax=Parageobacillus thermoglucosidasius TaxID=1426 RepID=A0AB38QVR4_PARTM|nr:ABC transporter C-terminal domain-containing protein [Parageobacillus thermoglucosidasius]UOE74708.1 DUF2339 domain-containing protein [Parageobacillus thermoglucosidasius]
MDQKRMEQLEQRIAVLEKEMNALKTQVERILQEGQEAQKATQAQERKEIIAPVKKGKTIQFKTNEGTVSPSVQRTESGPIDWEDVIGRVWLPRIFIFVLLLGLVWGFTIVAAKGILTEPVRILMGFAGSGLLVWLGEKQIKKQRESLGKVLLSGAISLLILTTFAMHVLYGMVPGVVAFILNVGWIVVGLQLAKRHKSEVISILTAFAGYLVPFLIEGHEEAATLFIVYETCFYTLLLLFSVKQGYKRLFYTASVLWHVVVMFYVATLLWDKDIDTDKVMLSAAFGAVIQHILIGYFGFKGKFQKIKVLPLVFTSFTITTLWAFEGFQFDLSYDELKTLTPFQVHVKTAILLDLYLLVSAGGYGFLAYKGLKKQEHQQTAVGLSISTLSVALLVYQLVDDNGFRAIIYLIMGTLAVYLGYRFKTTFQKCTGWVVYAIGAFITIADQKIREILSIETLCWFVLIGSLYALYRLINLHHATHKVLRGFMLGVNALTHLIFLSSITSVITKNWSISIQMMTLSFAWALYATAGIVFGVVKGKKNIRLVGIILLLLTLCKIVLVDLQFVTIIVRTVLFVGLGTIGLLVSRLFYVKK